MVIFVRNKKNFLPQIASTLESSPLAIIVKLEVKVCSIKASGVVAWGRPLLKCCRKSSSFSFFCRKSHNLIDPNFFTVHVQFSVLCHTSKKSNTETLPRSFKT